MNKLLKERFSIRFIGFFLLLIVTYPVISSPVSQFSSGNVGELYQFSSKIELAAPLPNELTINDVKIQNTLVFSYIFINNETFPIQKNVSQGTVEFETENFTVQSANVIDNLGNTFRPLNDSGLIMNPDLEIAIQPNSMYNISLVMVLMPGALYIDSYKAWEFGITLHSNLPTYITVTLPSNFAVPFYTAGAEYKNDQNYKVLTWQESPKQTLTVSAIFLPFLYSPETRSMNYSMDISSVFPIKTSKGTFSQEFESLSEYDGLIVPQIFEIPVLFPANITDTTVISVYDIDGQCTPILDPLSEINDTNSGTYYVDYTNREVLVYPRADIVENHYDYVVSVTFDFGNNVPSGSTFGFLMPYDSAVRSAVNLNSTGDWKLNITQNTIVEFLLPPGTQPYPKPDCTISYDNQNGRYMVRFVNTSSTWTTGAWEIDYRIVRLYNFFAIELSSIILLIAVIIVMTFLRKRQLSDAVRKLFLYFIPLVTGPGLLAAEYAIAPDWFFSILIQKTILTSLLVIQLFLAGSAIFLSQKWKVEGQNKS